MMRIDRQAVGTTVVLRLEGDIDGDGVNELRIALLNCLKEGSSDIVLNLAEVGFISYMGMGAMVERLRQFRAIQGDMKLTGLNTYAKRLFRVSGIHSLFDTYESEAQAVEVFQAAA